MAPQPLPPMITPPPSLPLHRRQDPNDPYGLSSLCADLSSLYADISSAYTCDLEGQLSSMMGDLSVYSLSDYSYPSYSDYSFDLSSALASLSAAYPTGTKDSSRITGTAASSRQSNEPSKSGGGGGLSTGGKIGIAVAVPVFVFALIGVGIFLWCAGKKKGKKNVTTIVQPPMTAAAMQPTAAPGQFQAQPYMGSGNQGYMAGYAKPTDMLPTTTPPPQYLPQQQSQYPLPGQQQQQMYPPAHGAIQPQQAYPPAQGHYTPPPQQVQGQTAYAAGGYGKGPNDNIAELGQEYQFARPGVVELGDGAVEAEPKKKSRWLGGS